MQVPMECHLSNVRRESNWFCGPPDAVSACGLGCGRLPGNGMQPARVLRLVRHLRVVLELEHCKYAYIPYMLLFGTIAFAGCLSKGGSLRTYVLL